MPTELTKTGRVARRLPKWPLALAALLASLALTDFSAAQLQPPPPTAPAQPEPTPGQPTTPGVAPPPPVSAASGEQETLRQLERADREDTGRGLQFAWLAPDMGFQWAALDTISNSDLIDDRVGAGSGLVFGGTAGLRWLFYTVGARFRYGLLDEFTLWSLGGDFALRLPLGAFEPYGYVGAGFARAEGFAANDVLGELGVTQDVEASGIDARIGGGFDYYVTPVFSTGVSLDAEFLFLSRDALATSSDTIYDSEGSAVGLALTSMAVLGLHF